jgi:CheY-like chemotaxis protein
MLEIAVDDSGIGIPPEKRAKVFEAFQQADTSMTRSRGGTGLGLTISRELVGMMGGQIGLESEFGRGSRFHFTIRCGRVTEPEGTSRTSRRIEHPMRTLLVDTNAVSARNMSLYLAKWAIDARLASTLGQAEAALSAADMAYDVVMLDLKGLGAPGIALARKIRDRAAAPALILMTELDASLADDAIDKLGAFATLTKPVRPSVLFDCLAAIASGNRDRGVAPFFVRHDRNGRHHRFAARVLVVEDNPINQEVATGILENMGCRVVTAPNGRHAVRLVAREKFDLILMDCEMPEMDGFEATRRIRELEKTPPLLPKGEATRPRVPIIALTAHALADIREKCLRAGMDDFLVKPFDERQMDKSLTRWLSRPAEARRSGNADTSPDETVAAASTPAARSTIDRSVIDGMHSFQGEKGRVLLQRVVTQFSVSAPEIGATIRNAFAAGDPTAVWQAAHSLKSSAAALGALQLSRRCADIETLARERGLAPVEELLPSLDNEVAAAVHELGELLEPANAA